MQASMMIGGRFSGALLPMVAAAVLVTRSCAFVFPFRGKVAEWNWSKSVAALKLWDKLDQVMDAFVIKPLFPEDNDQSNSVVDPDEVLAAFDLQNFNEMSTLTSAYRSLTNYLQLWARNLDLQPDKGLTTPITATDFRNASSSTSPYSFLDETSILNGMKSLGEGNESLSIIPPNVSMTLKFRPPKRYLSYKEQKSMEKGVLPDRKGAKIDAWSPGGVQLLVSIVDESKLVSFPYDESHLDGPFRLRLEARRCDIDGDTVIKYSSERAIVRRLHEAIRIWIKVRAR